MNNPLRQPVAVFACLAVSLLVRPIYAGSPGDPDPAYSTGADANGSARALVHEPTGYAYVGGAFTTYHGVSRTALVKLTPTGSVDTGFSANLSLTGYNGGMATVNALGLQLDGKIIVAGTFDATGQQAGAGVARLNTDGTVDKTFNPGTGVLDAGGAVGQAYAVIRLADGQFLVGGDFDNFNGVGSAGLVRLTTGGAVDTAFNRGGAGITGNQYGRNVKAIAVQPNGKILIGGEFSDYNGHAAGGIARLNADGTFDTTFDAGEGADIAVNAVAVQADGKILLGGGYNNFDGSALPHLLRLSSTGSLDTNYDPDGSGLLIQEVDAILVQPDGTALVGGVMRIDSGLVNEPHNGVIRVLADGTQDSSFDSGTDSRQGVALALQGDGKALVASNAYTLQAAPGNVFRVFDLAGTLTFGTSAYTVDENAGTITVHVLRNDGGTGAVSVVCGTSGGTAKPDTDYLGLSRTLNWADGDTAQKAFTVQLRDLGITNGSTRHFTLKLSSPGGGAILGTPATATVTIRENDPAQGNLRFGTSAYSVDENAGTITVHVLRTVAGSAAVSVVCGTTSGTAKSQIDYDGKSQTLTWAAGDNSQKAFTVGIKDRGGSGGKGLQFGLKLTSPTGGAVLDHVTTATVTIE